MIDHERRGKAGRDEEAISRRGKGREEEEEKKKEKIMFACGYTVGYSRHAVLHSVDSLLPLLRVYRHPRQRVAGTIFLSNGRRRKRRRKKIGQHPF